MQSVRILIPTEEPAVAFASDGLNRGPEGYLVSSHWLCTMDTVRRDEGEGGGWERALRLIALLRSNLVSGPRDERAKESVCRRAEIGNLTSEVWLDLGLGLWS